MLLTQIKLGVIAGLAVLLTACSGSDLDNKSAKTLYQEALQQLYAQDTQFNFKANIAVDIDNDNPMLTDLKINIAGAINNTAQHYELIPKVEAAIFNFKLPVFIDGKKPEILLDISNSIDVALLFVPQAQNELKQYRNKFIRFSPDNFDIDEEKMAQAVTIFSQVTKIGYAAIEQYTQAVPESSMEKLALDDKAKQLNAKTVLKLTLDQQQARKIQKHLNNYIYQQVSDNGALPADFKTEFLQALQSDELDSGFKSAESVLYLNDQGQVIHDINTFNYDIEDEPVSISMTVDYSNYDKADFSLSPRQDQIIELNEENIRALEHR